MPITTINELVGLLGASRLLDAAQLQQLNQFQRQFTDPRALAHAVVKRGWLTEYQIKMIANAKGGDLFFGPYIILDLLGAGGMGQVFKARQPRMDRVVAIKVVRKERLSNAEAVRRFRREMQTASQLAHPNIVLALDADQVGDLPYIVMEYVEGVDLAKLVKQQGPLPVGQACDYTAQAALGLQHAHERGLVHRDIKPSNLILASGGCKAPGSEPGALQPPLARGIVKILDMGLARATEPSQTDMSGTLTQAGAVIGTPDFISPEQARDSRTVDIRADLYSLGCTLYYLLTAQVPFPGGTPMEKLFKHQLEAPVPVEKLRTDLPRGLAKVVAGLLKKDPGERPQTPAEAARLLQPFAAAARSATSSAVTGTSPGRNSPVRPALAAEPEVSTADVIRKKRTSGLLPAPAPVTAALGSGQPGRRRLRSRSALLAVAAILVLAVGGAVLLSLGGKPASDPGVAGSTKPGDVPRTEGHAPLATKSALDLLDPTRIPPADRTGLPAETVALIGQQRFHHWGPVQAVAFSPDGAALASFGGDRQVRVWNAASGEQRAAFPFEGLGGSVGMGGPVGVGATVVLAGNRGAFVALMLPQQSLKVWDVNSSRMVFALPGPRLPGKPLSLSPDGRFLVWANPDNAVKLLELPKLQEHGTLAGVPANPLVSWAPDSSVVAVWSRGAARGAEIKVWDVLTGQERRTVTLDNEALTAVALAPGGQRLAVATNPNNLKLYNLTAAGDPEVQTLPATVHQMAFTPNGQTLAFALSDRVGLRDLASGKTRPGPATGTNGAAALVFSPDGRTLATHGSWDPAIHLWDVATGEAQHGADLALGMMRTQALSPDGQTLVISSGFPKPSIRLVDVPTGKVRASIAEGQPMAMFLAFAADSQTVLTRSSNSLDLWHAATGAPKHQVTLPASGQFVNAAATPDGRKVFTLHQGGKFWDGATLEPRCTLENAPTQQVHPVALSADGSRVALGEIMRVGNDTRCRLRVWDSATGKELPLNLPTLSGVFTSVALAPDGKWVAAVTTQGNIRLWDGATGQERLNVPEGPAAAGRPNMYTLVASPAGDCLFGWSTQQMKLWDAATGRERGTLPAPPEMPALAAFAPNGKALATADRSGRITLWNPATAAELRRLQLPGAVSALAFAADGRHLITGNANGTITIFRLPP